MLMATKVVHNPVQRPAHRGQPDGSPLAVERLDTEPRLQITHMEEMVGCPTLSLFAASVKLPFDAM